MQQIAEWLEKLGMSEYAQRFAENRIDLSVLPELTDQDLEKLGVVLGDRKPRAEVRGSVGLCGTLCNGEHFTTIMIPSPGGFTAKREPQIILKTDERKIVLEIGLGGKFAAKSTGWDENRVFLEGDSLRSRS